jgi:DNA (cytosine-5)-methyltransferase 1
MEPLKHFDLFSGYGGFTLALENLLHAKESEYEAKDSTCVGQSGVEPHNETRLGNTIGFSEIDKYASAVLKYHWPNIKNYGDIKKIDWSLVPDFDLLTGGSPCQDLSIAGKRAGLGGERSGLFYEYMRAVREKKPKYFIWENVKGALSSNKGFDFATVINEMAEAGYSLWWQICNSKDYGVPQNRERIFVVGFRDRTPPEVFFERGENKTTIEQINEPNHSNDRVYSEDGISPTLNTMQGGMRQPFIAKTVRTGERGSPHGAKQNWDSYEFDGRIRRLTVMECERLMGLPDGWTSAGGTISDSQRYKMCGNGVVVNVVERLIKELLA